VFYFELLVLTSSGGSEKKSSRNLTNETDACASRDSYRLPPENVACTKVYPKVFGLATWSDDCKWYSSLPLGAVGSLFYESI
jgi:hypothetical protein